MIKLIRKLEALERAPWKEKFRTFFIYLFFLVIFIHILHLTSGAFEGTLSEERIVLFGREYTGATAIVFGFIATPFVAVIFALIFTIGFAFFGAISKITDHLTRRRR